MTNNPNKIWDPFYGPDPLEGRINDLALTPYNTPSKTHFIGPISRSTNFQNSLHAYLQTRIQSVLDCASLEMLATSDKNGAEMVAVSIKKSKSTPPQVPVVKEKPWEKQSFASVVASGPGRGDLYCAFCKGNREDISVYSTHTTNNCLILKNYVCRICGLKGHTISHCKMNAGRVSVVQTMRRTDELSKLYDMHFPKQ